MVGISRGVVIGIRQRNKHIEYTGGILSKGISLSVLGNVYDSFV